MTDDPTHPTPEVMTLRARARASLTAVHHALTDAAALRTWLAEYAEVSLPRRYAFWGPSVPEGPYTAETDAAHQRPLHVDGHTVRFGWRLDEQDTTVEIGLAECGPATTVVTLTQSHMPPWADILAEKGSLGVVHTFWALALANLVDHLEGRPLTPRADLTSTSQRATVDVDAPAEQVWTALTESDRFSRWFGATVGIEPRPGGRFAMGGFAADPEPGTITDFTPDRRMTITWPDAVTTWELAGPGGRTRLTISNSGFDPARPPRGTWMGWLAGVAELRRYCELAGWTPIWQEVQVPGEMLVEQG
jgi:uncharacterized protein YndB with AHSA1/START domain